jgi:hypothetical protein
MFSKNTIVKVLFVFTIMLIIYPKFIRAEDDDDDVLGEIAIDLMIGFGMAVCETSVACSSFMSLVVIITLISLPFCLCADVIDPRDFCNKRQARRGLTTGIGYGLARR